MSGIGPTGNLREAREAREWTGENLDLGDQLQTIQYRRSINALGVKVGYPSIFVMMPFWHNIFTFTGALLSDG